MVNFWYLAPLLIAVSLTYGATRHEAPRIILQHAWHTAVWMLGFMGVIAGILLVLSWWT